MKQPAPQTSRRRLVVPAWFVIRLRGGIDDGRAAYPLTEVADLMGLPYRTAVDMYHRGEIPPFGTNPDTGPTAA